MFASDVPTAPPLSYLLDVPPRGVSSDVPFATTGGMIYHSYQAHSDLLWPLRAAATAALPALHRARDVPGEDMALRKLAAACEVFVLATLTHERPPFRLDTIMAGEREVAVQEEVAMSTPFGTLLHFRKEMPEPRAARADRRADVGPFRHAAARHRAHDARRPRRLHHRLAQRARRADRRRALRPRRIHRARDAVPGRARAGRAPDGDLPAVRGGTRGRGADVRGRPSGHAGQRHADGGADRLPDLADRGQQARDRQADLLVRAEPHQHACRCAIPARCAAYTPASCS